MLNLIRGARRALFTALLAATASAPLTAANFTLMVEPNYPGDQVREVYGPLGTYLNRTTGHVFTLTAAPNFNEHWRDLRVGTQAQFVFEEGHFFDYRRKRSGFVAVARTREPSAFAVVVADPDIANEGREGIVGRTVASLGSPNLGYLLVFDSYKNPLAQPEVRAVSTKWSDGSDLVFAGDVEGALLPAVMAGEIPGLTEVWRSPQVPGRVFSAAPSVPADVRTKVAEALFKLHEDPEGFAVMNELRTERLVPAAEADYDGMERLLVNSFGYEPPRRNAAARPAPAAPPAATPAPAPATTPPAN